MRRRGGAAAAPTERATDDGPSRALPPAARAWMLAIAFGAIGATSSSLTVRAWCWNLRSAAAGAMVRLRHAGQLSATERAYKDAAGEERKRKRAADKELRAAEEREQRVKKAQAKSMRALDKINTKTCLLYTSPSPRDRG